MWQRLCGFLVVFLLMFNGEIFGQINSNFSIPKKYNQNQPNQFDFEKLVFKQGKIANFPMYFRSESIRSSSIWAFVKVHSVCNYAICGDYGYYKFHIPLSSFSDRLGFFCKKELQLQKITNIPLRFRLGSLDYVNWMEQKPNAIKPR